MEFLVEKIGMSRTVGLKSEAVTLLRVLGGKLCTYNHTNAKNGGGEGVKALVAYSKGKAKNKATQGLQKQYGLSKEFNKFASLKVSTATEGEDLANKDLDLSPLASAKRLKVSMKTKGRGFTGVIKRWNFSGGPSAHGSRFHRTGGAIGSREFPGRVIKGKKMAGHYGNTLVTTQNSILSFDQENQVLVLLGSTAGHKGIYGRIKVIS